MNFPVFFPVSRELGAENGSTATASATNKFKQLTGFLYLAEGAKLHAGSNRGSSVPDMYGKRRRVGAATCIATIAWRVLPRPMSSPGAIEPRALR